MQIHDNFISIDIEATGAVPGLYSMIDIGACQVLDTTNTFSASLVELPGATWSTQTRRFWFSNAHNRQVLETIQANARPIAEVMCEFRVWLSQFRKPTLISFPVTFDFAFINYYWWLIFAYEPSFGWGGLDIKTLGMIATKSRFRETSKRYLKHKLEKKIWHGMKHTHKAIDDAQEQAILFKELIELI